MKKHISRDAQLVAMVYFRFGRKGRVYYGPDSQIVKHEIFSNAIKELEEKGLVKTPAELPPQMIGGWEGTEELRKLVSGAKPPTRREMHEWNYAR